LKNKLIAIIVSVVVLIGLFFIGSSVYKKSEQKRLGFLAQENSKVFAPDYSPVFGEDGARVVITEFLDPECESCSRFYPSVKKLLKMYKGKVKLVVRYAAFHANSVHAIKVLEATRKQNKYWESLGLLFTRQSEWASHHDPKPFLVFTLLKEMGINIDQLKKDMDDPKIMEIVALDAQALKDLKVKGTPTFFVNGKPLENFGVGYLYSAVAKAVAESYK
jgi:protein-disulfide isomerase